MLKKPKFKQAIEEGKYVDHDDEVENLKLGKMDLEDKVLDMTQKIEAFHRLQEIDYRNAERLNALYQAGIIDHEGKIINEDQDLVKDNEHSF